MDVHYKTAEALKEKVEAQEEKTNALIDAAADNDANAIAEDVCAKVAELDTAVLRINNELKTMTQKTADSHTPLDECAAQNAAMAEKIAKLEELPQRVTKLEELPQRVIKLEERPIAAPAEPVAPAPAPEAKPAPSYDADIARLSDRIKTLENRKPPAAPPPQAAPKVDLSGIENRIGQIEKALAGVVDAVENAAKAAPQEAPDLSDIYKRIANIEESHAAIKAEVGAVVGNLAEMKKDVVALEESMW